MAGPSFSQDSVQVCLGMALPRRRNLCIRSNVNEDHTCGHCDCHTLQGMSSPTGLHQPFLCATTPGVQAAATEMDGGAEKNLVK